MGDHKHKSGGSKHHGSKHHDSTRNTTDVHIGHSGSKDKKKHSKNSQNIRWICSQCGSGNNSLVIDAACPFCQWVRGPNDVTYIPDC
ncbi:hypothetical protein PG985_010606 [Apiospora marii]|uniref:RanBP2-type domain-containing protein n=1 Tax=Apiospora marii TaxID=335849 RepID=A0ABR1T1E8_9PEZI